MPYDRREGDVSRHIIATVLLPGERTRVDAAGSGCFAVVHRNSIPEAVRVVREQPVDAIVVSVHHDEAREVDALGHLLRDFPSVPTVALVSRHDRDASETLLHLGASGIRQVVDVTEPGGWHRLRQLISEPATRASARIQAPVFAALGDIPPDARLFFEVLIRVAPNTITVRRLAERLRIRPSTLMSRFSRAGLPSPKSYLMAVRLLHAAVLFDGQSLSVADVAYRLEYSSPQSFGRHLRAILGITSSEFRRRLPFASAIERFVDLMVAPYRAVLRDFHPLAAHGTPGGKG